MTTTREPISPLITSTANPNRGEDLLFVVLGSVPAPEARVLINEWSGNPAVDQDLQLIMWRMLHMRERAERAGKAREKRP